MHSRRVLTLAAFVVLALSLVAVATVALHTHLVSDALLNQAGPAPVVAESDHLHVVAEAHTAASTATMTKQAAAEKRLRERQAAGTRIPLYETQQQKVAADLVSKLPYILPPVGVLILTVLGFAVFIPSPPLLPPVALVPLTQQHARNSCLQVQAVANAQPRPHAAAQHEPRRQHVAAASAF